MKTESSVWELESLSPINHPSLGHCQVPLGKLSQECPLVPRAVGTHTPWRQGRGYSEVSGATTVLEALPVEGTQDTDSPDHQIRSCPKWKESFPVSSSWLYWKRRLRTAMDGTSPQPPKPVLTGGDTLEATPIQIGVQSAALRGSSQGPDSSVSTPWLP